MRERITSLTFRLNLTNHGKHYNGDAVPSGARDPSGVHVKAAGNKIFLDMVVADQQTFTVSAKVGVFA